MNAFDKRLWSLIIILGLMLSGAVVYSQTPPGPNTIQQGDGANMPTVTAQYGYFYGWPAPVNVTGRLFGNYTGLPLTGTTLDTGQGPNELYDMNQNVLTTSAVTFVTVDTGQGANELFPMDQGVRSTDDVAYANVTVTDELTLGGVPRTTWPAAFNQSLNTTDDVEFHGVTTGWVNLGGDNRTAWPSSGVMNVSDARYTHIVNSANDLENVIEGVGAGGHAVILANWTGSSVSSIVLPDVSSAHIEVYGLGMGITTITGDANFDVFDSAKVAWAAGTCLLELHELSVTSDSDQVLNALFWHTILKNVILNVYANDNAKGITIGGSGADASPSYWESVSIVHYDGVTTNSIMRIWLENFIGVGINIVLKSGVDITNVFELMGTSSTFIKPNFHQWQGRDVTGAIVYINGDGHYAQIWGFYGAESGGTDSIVNSFLRVASTSESFFHVSGTMVTAEDDMVTQLYYDDHTMRHTQWDALTTRTTGGYYKYPPPATIQITLWTQNTGSTSWENPGTILVEYPGLNNYSVDLTQHTKAKLIGTISGNEAGAKNIIAYDTTNNRNIANYTWSGAAVDYFESGPFNIQTYTGDTEITLACTASSGTEDLALMRVILVLYN